MPKIRTPIPQSTQDELMYINDRTCCVCRDKKDVQIHHIDENPSNNNIKNLLLVCPSCHGDIHTKKGLTKEFSRGVMFRYKEEWEALVKKSREIKVVEKSNIIDLTVTEIREEFFDLLNRTDLASSSKGKILLQDIYVWPEFEFYGYKSTKEESLEGSASLFLELENKFNFIKGTTLSGKTSLGNMIFLQSFQQDYFPLILNGEDIGKTTNYDKLIEREFTNQYSGEYANFLNSDKKILIIDNFNHKTPNSLVKWARNNFLKIFLLTGDEEYMLYFKDNSDYIEFDLFSIKYFNYNKQHDLIVNWLKIDWSIDSEMFYAKIDEMELKINDIITKSQIVPKTPFYILSIIQAFDLILSNELRITSYGHCYHALIFSQLIKKGISAEEIGICFNFLTQLAFRIYSAGNDGVINHSEYESFKSYYGSTFGIKRSILSKLENDEYPIINIKGNIKFELKYIYYYFVGKHIADKELSDEISKLCTTIYKKDSSFILVFTVHHTSSEKILEEIQLHCITYFDGIPEINLSAEDTKFLNQIILELPESIKSKKTIEENRSEERKMLQEKEKELQIIEDEIDHKKEKEVDEIFKSLKIMDVLGQIIKNRAGILENSKITELLLQVENLGLRILSSMLDTIKSSDFHQFLEAKINLLENEKKNNQMTSDEKRVYIEKLANMMAMGSIYGIIFKIFNSTYSSNVIDLQSHIASRFPFPAYELINTLFMINNCGLKPDDIGKLHKKYVDEKNAWAIRTLSYFVQLYMNTHYIDFRIKQQICSILNIPYSPNKILKD